MKKTNEKITKATEKENDSKIKRKSFLFREEAEWLWDHTDQKARILSADFRQVTSGKPRNDKLD